MELLITLLAVGTLWTVAVIVPGPNLFILLQTALQSQKNSSLFVVLGIAFGTAVWAISALLGITLLFKTVPWTYIVFKILGGVYLIYLGIKLIRTSYKTTTLHSQQLKQTSNKEAFLIGTLTNLSNPKTALFVTSLFATTVPKNPSLELGVLSVLTMVVISLSWYGTVAFLMTLGGFKKLYNRLKKYIDRVAGVVFIGFGSSILTSK